MGFLISMKCHTANKFLALKKFCAFTLTLINVIRPNPKKPFVA